MPRLSPPFPHRGFDEWATGDPERSGILMVEEIELARSEISKVSVVRIVSSTHGYTLTLRACLADSRADITDFYTDYHDFLKEVPRDHVLAVEDLPEELLLFGVEFEDGRSATNLGGALWPLPESPYPILLVPLSGGQGQTTVEETWWLSPKAPTGAVRIFIGWRAAGIEETAVDLHLGQ